MSRDVHKEKLRAAEDAAARQLHSTETSAGLLRQKLQQCERERVEREVAGAG